MKTYIITGYAGFIGSHISEKLIARGNRIIGIDNFNDFYDPRIKRKNAEEIGQKDPGGLFIQKEGDIRDYSFLNQVFSSLDGIERDSISLIHIAAMAGVRPSLKNPGLYEEVNIKGTLNLLDMCRKFNVKNMLFASSSSVYGNNKKIPFSEEDPVDNPISVYATTKKAGELFCHTYCHLYRMRIIACRFFTVYGPRQRPDLAIHKFIRKIYRGEAIPVYGDGSMKRDYTYIDDIADGVLKALERLEDHKIPLEFEIYNLGESHTVPLSYLIEVIENKLNKKAIIDRQPPQPGDVQITYANISKAKRMLGYSPSTNIEEGIEKFVKWFKAQ